MTEGAPGLDCPLDLMKLAALGNQAANRYRATVDRKDSWYRDRGDAANEMLRALDALVTALVDQAS